jgi:ABC-type branched-subunit amino acid transport system ATPase component
MLKLSAVRAGYGQSGALHGIGFDVTPREIVVFVGRNGMGQGYVHEVADRHGPGVVRQHHARWH